MTGVWRPPAVQPKSFDPARAYTESVDSDLPAEAMYLFLFSWIELYGLVCMEVMGQLDFAYGDPEVVFEHQLRKMCASYGVSYEPPTPTAAVVGRGTSAVGTRQEHCRRLEA